MQVIDREVFEVSRYRHGLGIFLVPRSLTQRLRWSYQSAWSGQTAAEFRWFAWEQQVIEPSVLLREAAFIE